MLKAILESSFSMSLNYLGARSAADFPFKCIFSIALNASLFTRCPCRRAPQTDSLSAIIDYAVLLDSSGNMLGIDSAYSSCLITRST